VQQRPDAARPGGASSIFEQFLEFVPDAIVGVDRSSGIVLVNRRAEELFGFEREELIGQDPEVLVPERFREAHAGHRGTYFEKPQTRPMGSGPKLFAVRRDGTEFPVEVSLSHLELSGKTIATVAVRDLTERAESEREQARQDNLQRARQMDSVGQLAGGIAHDFNNILAVIMNYAEFVSDEMEPGSSAHQDVEEIRRAAERAAGLTRQLLIFGRRETLRPQLLDLTTLVRERENLLREGVGGRVEMEVSLEPGLWPIEADPDQIGQVLVNLSVNARDAMPKGGRLLIEAENVELDDEYAFMHPDTPPGRYVRLKVSDTGTGMDCETVDRVFEPFFTTKSENTGLGLATVYGIATSAGGRVDVYSEPGIGTTVKVHLPVAAAAAAANPPETSEYPVGDGQVVLLVEDEEHVRRIAERILTKGGYTVIGTEHGAEALEICGRPDQDIDLLLTDVIMPELLGPELVEHARAIRPALRAVYMSGYSHGVLAPQTLAANGESAFIEKPFNARALLETVRELLERPATPA